MRTKGASGFLKQVVSLVTSIFKAKSLELKTKTSEVKARLVVLGLFRNKKLLMSAISHKIHALVSHQEKQGRGRGAAADHDEEDEIDESLAIIQQYRAVSNEEEALPDLTEVAVSTTACGTTIKSSDNGDEVVEARDDYEEEEDDGYPDLRHSLFDEEDDQYLRGDDGTGSVIDLVKNLRGEEQGEFVLEDEIDHVADVFIRRFHRQIKMQKLESFKRFREMMERSV